MEENNNKVEVFNLSNKNDTETIESIKKENVMGSNNDILQPKEEKQSKLMTPQLMPEPIMTPEDAQLRRSKILEVSNWINHPRLGRHLIEFRSEDLNSKTIQELDVLLAEIKYTVNSKNNTFGMENAFKTGNIMIETMTNRFTNYDLTGYSQIMNNDDRVLDTVAEISLNYQNLSYVSPEKRLMYYMISSAIAVNSMNKAKQNQKVITDNLSKKLDEKVINKYNDL